MKRVRGYLTQDGTFFELEVDANLYEAEIDLRTRSGNAKIDPDRLIDALRMLHAPIRKYLNAIENKKDNEANSAELVVDRDAFLNQPNDGSTETNPSSVQQLKALSDEHVPDVGSDPQPEAVRKQRKGART